MYDILLLTKSETFEFGPSVIDQKDVTPTMCEPFLFFDDKRPRTSRTVIIIMYSGVDRCINSELSRGAVCFPAVAAGRPTINREHLWSAISRPRQVFSALAEIGGIVWPATVGQYYGESGSFPHVTILFALITLPP